MHHMSALMYLLTLFSCYVDFALWGSYHIRTHTAFKCVGMIPGPPDAYGRATLMHEERKGPPDYPHWRKCWNNGMHTDSYGYNRIWASLYQCDNRYRHEHMPRMLISALLKLERLIEKSSTGQATLVHVLEDGREVEFHPARMSIYGRCRNLRGGTRSSSLWPSTLR